MRFCPPGLTERGRGIDSSSRGLLHRGKKRVGICSSIGANSLGRRPSRITANIQGALVGAGPHRREGSASGSLSDDCIALRTPHEGKGVESSAYRLSAVCAYRLCSVCAYRVASVCAYRLSAAQALLLAHALLPMSLSMLSGRSSRRVATAPSRR